ncbi:MAG: PspC domain-containing protein [Bdellovibrionales bacterium]|nr:PspC domain-containing protein [Bdellovibrionales bacterium]
METQRQPQWIRAREGWIFGVCQGLAKTLGVEPVLLRALAVLSACLLGTGILFYLVAAMTLPIEDEAQLANQKKFLGVCNRLSRLTGLEVGLVRFLTVIIALPSLGTSALIYVGLHFVLKDQEISSSQ